MNSPTKILTAERETYLAGIKTHSDGYLKITKTSLNLLSTHILIAALIASIIINVNVREHIINKSLLGDILSYSLTLYFAVYSLLRCSFDVFRLQLYKRKLNFWKATTSELISECEYKAYIKKPLEGCQITLCIFYPFIILVHFVIVCICYDLNAILSFPLI